MKNNKTKGRILDKSIEMFNERQASNVSTVQISKEMDISPGNLYYYYSNKEEIIRRIWEERMCTEIKELASEAQTAESEEKLREYCGRCVDHYFRYRFFYLEMPTLFVNDNELKKSYLTMVEKEVDCACKIIDNLIDIGEIRTIDETEKRITAENLVTLIKHSWIDAFCCLCDSDEKSYEEYTCKRMKAFMSPYKI